MSPRVAICARPYAKPPNTLVSQSTTDAPECVGISYATDVIKRNKQLILVLRECVTSFTLSALIASEHHDTIRDVLIELCVGVTPLDGPHAVIRTDPALPSKRL
jgi:hypothetical protein